MVLQRTQFCNIQHPSYTPLNIRRRFSKRFRNVVKIFVGYSPLNKKRKHNSTLLVIRKSFVSQKRKWRAQNPLILHAHRQIAQAVRPLRLALLAGVARHPRHLEALLTPRPEDARLSPEPCGTRSSFGFAR